MFKVPWFAGKIVQIFLDTMRSRQIFLSSEWERVWCHFTLISFFYFLFGTESSGNLSRIVYCFFFVRIQFLLTNFSTEEKVVGKCTFLSTVNIDHRFSLTW